MHEGSIAAVSAVRGGAPPPVANSAFAVSLVLSRYIPPKESHGESAVGLPLRGYSATWPPLAAPPSYHTTKTMPSSKEHRAKLPLHACMVAFCRERVALTYQTTNIRHAVKLTHRGGKAFRCRTPRAFYLLGIVGFRKKPIKWCDNGA